MSWQPDITVVAEASAAQRKLLNPLHHVWVGAHAGTGKTETLTRRIAALLLSDPNLTPDQILALTYTRAGAGEMKVRLPQRLAAWADLPADKQADLLTQLLGRTPRESDIARLHNLPELLRDKPLWIHTIHGLSAEILGRFPTEANVPVGFGVVEEGLAQNDLLQHAQKQVFKAAEHDDNLRTVLTLLVERLGDHQVSNLVELVTKDWDKLLQVLTNSVRSHGGISEKLMAELEATTAPVGTPSTALLSQWQTLLRTAGGANNLKIADRIAEVLKNPHSLLAWEDLFFTATGPRARWLDGDKKGAEALESSGLIPSLTQLYSLTTNWLTQHRAAQAYELTQALFIWVAKVRQAYESAKAEQGLLDYADLITKARTLLEGDSATQKAWVLYRLDRDIKHILLDEAQDNSGAQNAIFNALAEELVKEDKPENPRTVLAVGDVKQSIYRFQGAAPAKFTGIQSWLMENAPHRTTTGTLSHSFRSATQILQLADATWHGDAIVENPHHTVRPSATGFVQLHLLPSPPKTDKPEGWLTAQERESTTQNTALGAAVTLHIQTLVGRLPLASRKGRLARYEDILILTRHTTAAAELTGYLRAHGIPTLFLANPKAIPLPLSVQDHLALVEAALNPANRFALGQVLASPFVGWPLEKVALWLQGKVELPSHLTAWLAVQKHTLLTLGKAAWLARRMSENHPAADASAPHHLAALMLSAQASDSAGEDPTTWAEKCRINGLATLAPSDIDTPSAVRIMTIHSAKGLESPLVILPETTFQMGKRHGSEKLLWEEDPLSGEHTGVLFHRSSATPPAYQTRLMEAEKTALLEDDKRLLYVALTRAEEGLLMFAEADAIKDTNWSGHLHAALRRLGAIQTETTLSFGQPSSLQTAQPQPTPITVPPISKPQAYHQVSPAPVQQSPQQQRGTLLHALLATLPAQPRTHWPRIAQLLAAPPELMAEATRILESFPDLFTGEALVEHDLTLPNGTSGRIDRLIIAPESVTLVDFKTDAILPATPPPAYVAQLTGYMAALQPHFTQPVKAVLLYTSHNAALWLEKA